MRKSLITLALAAAGGAAAFAVTADTGDRTSRFSRDQARLTREIAKLTPQQPVNCIDTRWSNASLRAIGPKLIYRVNARRIYVSETAGGCERVARGDTLVTRQFGTRLCRGDIASTVDFVSRTPTGSCAIGPFTPYTPG